MMRANGIGVGLLFLVGGCVNTWHVPPGADQATFVGALLGAENRIMADIMTHGFPDTGMLRYREGYVLSYDGRTRGPRWVAERLNAKRLAGRASRRGLGFRVDRSLPPHLVSQSYDFEDSEYVRGRMAAAANHPGDATALEQTYYLSNVVPQHPAFRQGFWVPLERRIRAWARASDDLYVVTGPLYLPAEGSAEVRYDVIGKNRVAVPTHFFKVLLRERGGRRSMLAFVVPHDPARTEGADPATFLASVDEVEALAGLDFFPDLSEPTQSTLEGRHPDAIWE